jgi:hypothetical protein
MNYYYHYYYYYYAHDYISWVPLSDITQYNECGFIFLFHISAFLSKAFKLHTINTGNQAIY